jgi:glycerophosphoryl diester phosphodiesterase
MVAPSDSPELGERGVIELRGSPGEVLRIGHRGAATLAPENTLRSFRAATEIGVDVIEFDVLDLRSGPLVLAHSDRLEEVSHGAARGRVRSQSLEQLREIAPELPTLDEALAFFVDEAPAVGLHIDLKLRIRHDELAAAIVRHGLDSRTIVTGVHVADLLAVGRAAPKVQVGITYPDDRLSISRKPYLWPIVSLGLTSMRASVPIRVPRLARRAGASAVMLQHRLVTASAVERSHAAGLPVWAWTVDERADYDRVIAAGVDGIITNDPRIFLATLKA